MKNVTLFIAAILLLVLFSFLSLFVASILIIKGKTTSKYFFESAVAIDVLGNVMCQFVLGFLFIQKHGYQFGQRGETISSVLGKNQRDNTLKWFGKLMVLILDLFEKDHCFISILEF